MLPPSRPAGLRLDARLALDAMHLYLPPEDPMTFTLSTLRALLERALHTDGPTPAHIARIGASVTVEKLAQAYLPRRIYYAVPARRGSWLCDGAPGYTHHVTVHDGLSRRIKADLDLTDVGTVHALLVALALALGLDPGVMGCAVSWRCGAWGWVLRGADSSYMMGATIDEPDPIRALCAAVEHVLKESTDVR